MKSNGGTMKKIFVIFLCIVNLYGSTTMKISYAEDLEGIEEMSLVRQSIISCFEKLDYKVEFVSFPNKRSLELVNSGEVDGEFPRTIEVLTDYKNLFLVKVPVKYENFYAYYMGESKYNEWKNLDNKRVGVTFGSYVSENSLAKNVKNFKIEKLKDRQALFNMLLSGRVDVLYLPESVGNRIVKDNPKHKLFKSNKPLFTEELYLVMNKKHLKIKSELEKQMKKTLN